MNPIQYVPIIEDQDVPIRCPSQKRSHGPSTTSRRRASLRTSTTLQVDPNGEPTTEFGL